MKKDLKKVLVLGSGALKIGQAGCLLYTSDRFTSAESIARRRHSFGVGKS